MSAFWNWLKSLFSSPAYTYISKVPAYGDVGDHVRILQEKLKEKGYGIIIDGKFGIQTRQFVSAFQKAIGLTGSGIIGKVTLENLGLKLGQEPSSSKLNPAYIEAKKYEGKKETDSAFNKFVSAFWPKVGLSNYKTIVGTTFAWCAIFIGLMNSEVGQEYLSKGGAGAKNYAAYGVGIDFKKLGIPKSAVVQINTAGKCGSGSNNHVTFADGSCTPETVAKPSSTFPGYGGNQGNMVKTSWYKMSTVCAVRWPEEIPLPPKVTKNDNCGGATASGDSTR